MHHDSTLTSFNEAGPFDATLWVFLVMFSTSIIFPKKMSHICMYFRNLSQESKGSKQLQIIVLAGHLNPKSLEPKSPKPPNPRIEDVYSAKFSFKRGYSMNICRRALMRVVLTLMNLAVGLLLLAHPNIYLLLFFVRK